MYRKISDPNSNNNTKDVHLSNNQPNWTDIFDVNDNDRYELTVVVFNNKGLSAETIKYTFDIAQGMQLQLDKIIVDNKLEKVFKKKHSSGFIFSKLCYTPIFLIHIFSIKINHSSMNIFSINIYTCPVNIHSHFKCTD